MFSTDVFLAVLRAASIKTDGHAAAEQSRIVAAWVERQRCRTELA